MKYFKKIVSLIISIHFIIPTAFADQGLEAKKTISSKKCGDFEVVLDIADFETTEAYRCDDGIDDKKYKTPGGKVKLHVSEKTFSLVKNVDEVADLVLLNLIRKKIKVRFDEKLAKLDLTNQKPFYDAYIKMQNQILNDGKSPKRQIRKLLVLFPDIEKEIEMNNPDYKTLICRYEVWKHNQKIIKDIAIGFSILEMAALLAAAPIAASVVLAANVDKAYLLAQILIVGGAAGIIGGALQIQNDITKWDQVTASKNAKMLLKFYEQVEDEIKKLRKDQVANKEKIIEYQKWLPTESELQQLKQTKKLAFKEYKSLFLGLTKVGLGVVLVFGGSEVLKMLSNFEKESSLADPTTGSIAPPW
ncbi:MAG: hypothetical protein ACOYL6_17195 [Bacteriovoracaceae bacterium]